ncbi:MAG: hypothetical protein QOF77_2267 [Solirubrobacteraceae bacterium]|jgi:hypothetical protein|nr:hypothetical protein [Solirubrobacteraceae bacterium]
MDGVPVIVPDRMLGPVRRWALRELKVHPGQVVVVVGCPVAWTLPVLRELVCAAGALLVFEDGARRAREASERIAAGGWSNVAVVAEGLDARELPPRADRVLLDDDRVLGTGDEVERLIGLLGPSGRLAAVCRRPGRPWAGLEDRLPGLRRESFYWGAAHAVWGQVR